MKENEFDIWYNKTYPDTVGKYDAVNVACRVAAASGWEAARKGYIKLEDVIDILEKNKWEQTIGVSPVIGMKAIEEIKKLDNKKVTLEDVMLAEQSKDGQFKLGEF